MGEAGVHLECLETPQEPSETQLALGYAETCAGRFPWPTAVPSKATHAVYWARGPASDVGMPATLKAVARHAQRELLRHHRSCLQRLWRLRGVEELRVIPKDVCPLSCAFVVWRLSLDAYLSNHGRGLSVRYPADPREVAGLWSASLFELWWEIDRLRHLGGRLDFGPDNALFGGHWRRPQRFSRTAQVILVPSTHDQCTNPEGVNAPSHRAASLTISKVRPSTFVLEYGPVASAARPHDFASRTSSAIGLTDAEILRFMRRFSRRRLARSRHRGAAGWGFNEWR